GRAPALETPVRAQIDPTGNAAGREGAGALRARSSPHGHAIASQHDRDLRLWPHGKWNILLCHGVPAGTFVLRSGSAPRPIAARPGRLSAAASVPGARGSTLGRLDSSRHQAVKYLRLAPRRP